MEPNGFDNNLLDDGAFIYRPSNDYFIVVPAVSQAEQPSQFIHSLRLQVLRQLEDSANPWTGMHISPAELLGPRRAQRGH